MPLAYLFSRYPVVSQTFCDSEMLSLEAQGHRLVVASLNPPPTSFRHERLRSLQAEVFYPPPASVLKEISIPPAMATLAAAHDAAYGTSFKAATRARNAAWLAPVLARQGVRHLHIHFANRATHTALFLKKAGFSFSFTAHAQDYMIDLGSDLLLQELAREAEFTVAVSDFSQLDLHRRCPDSTHKIHRIYNGVRLADFPTTTAASPPGSLHIVSIGRLIEFKGFHHLIEAVALLRSQGLNVTLEIIGEGPWRPQLLDLIASHALTGHVHLAGVLSQESIKSRLARSDVFALACCVDAQGASDILPTVIMEAMAARLPVVSTRVAGVPEMVVDGVTGRLTPPADPAALAEALRELASDPSLRTALGTAGQALCAERFSLETTAGELSRRFQPLLVPSPSLPTDSTPLRPPTTLILSTAAAEPELAALVEGESRDGTTPPLGVLAVSAAHPPGPPWLEFLPDAIVLEAAWRASPDDAAACEAWYNRLGTVEGEIFFRDARRAVHTASIVRRRSHRHVHAARADTLLWTWLVAKLTGITASYAIESHPPVSRSLLARLIPDFAFGSLADEKLAALTKSSATDLLGLAPPPKSSLFRLSPRPSPDVSGFRRRLLTPS
jgi:glycosyltransferase involved in cell wall biosynthesis